MKATDTDRRRRLLLLRNAQSRETPAARANVVIGLVVSVILTTVHGYEYNSLGLGGYSTLGLGTPSSQRTFFFLTGTETKMGTSLPCSRSRSRIRTRSRRWSQRPFVSAPLKMQRPRSNNPENFFNDDDDDDNDNDDIGDYDDSINDPWSKEEKEETEATKTRSYRRRTAVRVRPRRRERDADDYDNSDVEDEYFNSQGGRTDSDFWGDVRDDEDEEDVIDDDESSLRFDSYRVDQLLENIIIPSPLLDSIDPDGAVDRFPELIRDPRFWFDLVLLIAFLDFASDAGPGLNFPFILY